jgi:hypothetical protein
MGTEVIGGGGTAKVESDIVVIVLPLVIILFSGKTKNRDDRDTFKPRRQRATGILLHRMHGEQTNQLGRTSVCAMGHGGEMRKIRTILTLCNSKSLVVLRLFTAAARTAPNARARAKEERDTKPSAKFCADFPPSYTSISAMHFDNRLSS